MIKLLIVDDEDDVRELLEIFLQSYHEVEVIGSAPNVDEALKLSIKHRPDIVLLDISMPGRDGFEYITEIQKKKLTPGIIFVTAFENYAIKAIRSAAFDYLLKPIKKEELYNALDRFIESGIKEKTLDYSELADLLTRTKHGRIKLNTRTGFFFVDPAEVIYCEADGNYSHIALSNTKIEISTLNLGSLEKIFDQFNFFRISRSFLINLKHLARVDRKSNICELECNGITRQIKVPSQKIKLLEDYF